MTAFATMTDPDERERFLLGLIYGSLPPSLKREYHDSHGAAIHLPLPDDHVMLLTIHTVPLAGLKPVEASSAAHEVFVLNLVHERLKARLPCLYRGGAIHILSPNQTVMRITIRTFDADGVDVDGNDADGRPVSEETLAARRAGREADTVEVDAG